MVKILQTYNFAKQNTFSLNSEILAATLIDSNRIAISSAEQFIEIYHIGGIQHQDETQSVNETNENLAQEERSPKKYTLATIGEVVNLIYCEAGKYLLTLEKESVGSPVHSNSTSISCRSNSNTSTVCSDAETKMFVRIYANFWKFPDAKLIDLPITIRIASMTTPKAPLVESIDVIELPLRSPPDLIQCCPTSGNIIVSSKERIYLYEYTQCTHEAAQPRFSYIDFLPFKFFVSLNFIPLRMKLAENVIACLNNRYCVAFKIVDVVDSSASASNAMVLNCHEDGDHEMPSDVDPDEAISISESSFVSKGSAGPSSHNSFETDSLETMSSERAMGTNGLPRVTPIDFKVAMMTNSVNGHELIVDIRSQWDDEVACSGGINASVTAPNASCDTQDITINPVRANDIKIKLVNEAKAMNVQRISNQGNVVSAYHDDSTVQYDVRKLLQICIKTSEPNGRIVDILRCIDLKAIYQRRESNVEYLDDSGFDVENQQIPSMVSTTKHANRRTLKSNVHHSCVGYALLVASSVDGYLYQFCAQGKWYSENEKPVAVYSFTAPVLHVHINDYVIYAVTSESVETHTSRIGHKLFNNRFEYPSLGHLFPEESSPDVNAPIAVIGLCSFMHVQYVCVSDQNLILISNGSVTNPMDVSGLNASHSVKRRSGEVKKNLAARLIAEAKAKHSLLRSGQTLTQQSVVNEWTLYNLEIPQVEDIIEDLEAVAESYRSASSSNFYDLMEEAHIMLRLSLSLQCDKLTPQREQHLRLKFIDNCRKLADFSIRSKKKEVHLQATGFYKMCNMQLIDIYNNYIENFMNCDQNNDSNDNTERVAGLIYTVKVFLLSLGADRLKSAFLNQLVKPFFTPNRVIEQGFPLVPVSLEFLNMFIKYSPGDIPQIMLHSSVVADSISGELINYLKYLDKLNPDENLLLAVTACRMSNYLLAKEVISKSHRRDLAVALIKHKNVLFDDGTILFQKSVHGNGVLHTRQTQSSRSQKSSKLMQTMHAHQAQSVSFSDFTEIILLATESPDLIEAISDVFIHALSIEHSVTLEMILQLFLNYIAAHIGHKGYQTSQKVFCNILQVYYHNLFDVCSNDMRSNTPPQMDDDFDEASSKAISLNSERDNESISNSLPESNESIVNSSSEEHSASRYHRIIYDPLQDVNSPSKFNPSVTFLSHEKLNVLSVENETNLKGLKILFRMYLGRLKALSDLITDSQSADLEQQPENEHNINLRLESIKMILRHLQELRAQNQQPMRGNVNVEPQFYYAKTNFSGNVVRNIDAKKPQLVSFIPDYKLNEQEFDRHVKSYIRPIPCLLDRPQYLNRLPPFKRTDFTVPNTDEGEYKVRFIGWNNEHLTLTLKIQSLLAYSKIDRSIIEEFIAFIQKTPNLIGIDSFLVIISPKNLAVNYMLNFFPEYLWHYGKSNAFSPKHWESLLRKIQAKRDLLPKWKAYVSDILDNLVAELTFEELLQCIPGEVMKNRNERMHKLEMPDNSNDVHSDEKHNNLSNAVYDIPRDHFPMDNIDEDNVFELSLRKAVAKQRSLALRAMIVSTGTQLFDAINNPMYNL